MEETKNETMDANEYKDLMLNREQQYFNLIKMIVEMIGNDDLTKRFLERGVTFEELFGETMLFSQEYNRLKENYLNILHASLNAANEIGEMKFDKEELYREKLFWNSRCERMEQLLQSSQDNAKERLSLIKEIYTIITDAHHNIEQPFNELKTHIIPKIEQLKEENRDSWDTI